MKSTRETSVRRLASGSYIVSGVRSRSAVTGRFVTSSTAKRNPGKTVAERSTKGSSKSQS